MIVCSTVILLLIIAQSEIGKMERVGIIAGFGDYPVLLAGFLSQKNYEVYCIGVRDQADPRVLEYCKDHLWMGFGQFGKAVRFFKKHKVSQATMAGGIS